MNLLITGAIEYNKEFFSSIEELGHSIVYVKDERIKLDNIQFDSIEGVICNSLFVNNDIRHFTNLKFIQLTSAGYDRVPLDYIKAHNIRIFNARGVYSTPIAEYVLCCVLDICKKMQTFRINQKNSCWIKQRDLLELYGKNVCIVGCGSVGTECAKRFSAFGCNVYGVDIKTGIKEYYSSIVGLDDLDTAIEKADIVVLTLPLTKDTYHLFDKERLKKLKDGSVLVNVARGAIVDADALIHEIPRLRGAVIDVFETEPLSSDSPLWNMKNVIVTPHNSFVGEHNIDRLQQVILDNLKSL